ncbi:MAG: histidine--tRNA ligase [Truepera sp.]|nr:histidine--tRNA ligase [Truepera sp.]
MKLQAAKNHSRFARVKGTHDTLPEAHAQWARIAAVAKQVLERAGAVQLTPPIFEYSEVFTKSVGESADLVVQKEMYTFFDAGARSLTLRPEFTAGVLRAFIEHGLYVWPSPIKLWSIGPVFRAEKPQRGRFRQFHQVNCELLGLDAPLLDAEAITLLYQIFSELGLRGLVVKLGSVGDPEDRQAYNHYLREALTPLADRLSEASRERLRLNPMRVLDSKSAEDQAVVASLKRPLDFLGEAAKVHFAQVQAYLSDWQLPFELEPNMVRGLDYYRRTAFEFHHGAIGAQSALCGGGRYDGLVEQLGGPPTPGVGWAFGLERLLDALQQEGALPTGSVRPLLYLIPMDEEAVGEVAKAAFTLRRHGVVLHAYAPRNPGKGLKEADRAGAVLAALRGSRERAHGSYQIKELASGAQFEVPEGELAAFLRGHQARDHEANTLLR